MTDKELYENPNRTEIFQKWMDSLESKSVKRIRVMVDGKLPERFHPRNKSGR